MVSADRRFCPAALANFSGSAPELARGLAQPEGVRCRGLLPALGVDPGYGCNRRLQLTTFDTGQFGEVGETLRQAPSARVAVVALVAGCDNRPSLDR
jgi:hypothetical protein